MKSLKVMLVIFVVIAALSAAAVDAAVATGNRATMGTTQLAGQDAVIGTTYTLGKAKPINITVHSIEYTVAPVPIGTGLVVPKKEEKLMVVHFDLHNPNKYDFGVSWSTLTFTVVDSADKNWKYTGAIGVEATKANAAMSLKPAQRTEFYTVIIVPAASEMPKLMIETPDRLVLRYDLKGKVKPLPAPIADPQDPSGATALQEVPAKMGVAYPSFLFDVKLDKVEFTTSAINGKAPKKGCRYFVAVGTAKNITPVKQGTSWHVFDPKLFDQDGAPFKWNGDILLPSRDERIVSGQVEPGKEFRFRHYFEVPENVNLSTFSLTQAGGRTYVYDVSAVK